MGKGDKDVDNLASKLKKAAKVSDKKKAAKSPGKGSKKGSKKPPASENACYSMLATWIATDGRKHCSVDMLVPSFSRSHFDPRVDDTLEYVEIWERIPAWFFTKKRVRGSALTRRLSTKDKVLKEAAVEAAGQELLKRDGWKFEGKYCVRRAHRTKLPFPCEKEFYSPDNRDGWTTELHLHDDKELRDQAQGHMVLSAELVSIEKPIKEKKQESVRFVGQSPLEAAMAAAANRAAGDVEVDEEEESEEEEVGWMFNDEVDLEAEMMEELEN